jgi:hypothetical protein
MTAVTLLVCWLVFPLVLGLVSLGCGLLVEALAGTRLPRPLVPVVGIALVIVAGDLATATGATARLATPLVIALAVAGYGLSYPWRTRRIDPWPVAAAAAVFAVYAAPIVLTGSATFAGYVTLDDTATWLALADRAVEHGRTLSGLAPSTYHQVLDDYFGSGYPLGGFVVLGIGGNLSGQDVAWLFQPTIAFLGAMLALAIYALCGRLVRSRPLRAAVAFVAAQPALLFAYALWSGLKELAAAAIIALVAALVASTLDRWTNVRGAVPAAVGVAALFAVLSPAGGVWLVALTLVVAGLLLVRGRGTFLRAATWMVVLVAVLSIPSIVIARSFISDASSGELTATGEVANLGHPLDTLQIFGIWPATDFRTRPHDPTATYVLIGVLIAAAVLGALMASRRRAWGIPLYLVTGVGGAVLLMLLRRVGLSSPWLNAKGMAQASPAIVAAAMAGAAALFETGRRTEAVLAGTAIAAGVLWSNGLAYSNAWIAPRSQLAELQTIGNRFAGVGPSLMTEYQPYGVRHFLRHLDPEAASERRERFIALRTGGDVPKGNSADLDEFDLDAILTYRTLVLRRSPVGSRPPSVYRLVWKGHWYEVWQRPERYRRILEHLSLGGPADPAAVPPCREVLRLARRAQGAGGRLAAVTRPGSPLTLDLTHGSRPERWATDPAHPGTLVPRGGGDVELSAEITRAGRYGLWLGGSFRRTVMATVDGREAGSARDQLNNQGQWTSLGEATIRRGSHRVVLHYGGSRIAPGAGGFPLGMGPLVLSTSTGVLPVSYVEPSAARSLCGLRLDWVEALGP